MPKKLAVFAFRQEPRDATTQTDGGHLDRAGQARDIAVPAVKHLHGVERLLDPRLDGGGRGVRFGLALHLF